MDWLFSVNNDVANWLWSYRSYIATSWVAVILVLYGDAINGLVKRLMQPYHYVLKVLAFVLLCSVGYGLLATYGYKIVQQLLPAVERKWFAVFVIITYFVLGSVAERKRQA